MPAAGVPHVAKNDLLSRDQLVLLGRVAVEQGIRKIRITGGEPLMRPDIVPLLADLGSLPDLERLVLTTNGIRLASLVGDLKAAGVSGVNVSMDSLRDDRFAEITRGGNRRRCWEGIEAALAAGLRTKVNVVIMAEVNEDEVLDFARLAQDHPLEIRFIEYMPTAGRPDDAQLTVPSAQLLERLSGTFDLTPLGH
jgi:cyclic pyranopterin phosphate synthase